jgi:hypothetical protein
MGFCDYPEDMRNDVTGSVIHTIVNHKMYATNLAIAPTATQRQDLSSERMDINTLVIAVYAQNEHEVTAILDYSIDPWVPSRLFLSAIQTAVIVNNRKIAEILLAAARKTDVGLVSKDRKQVQARVMKDSIDSAVWRRGWTMAEQLMEFSAKYIAKPPPSAVNDWVMKAVSSDAFDTLVTMRDTGCIRSRTKHYANSIVRGLLANANPDSALRFCTEKRFLLPRTRFLQNRSLLEVAIDHDNPRLVKTAVGMDPNDDYANQLRMAIMSQKTEAVRALLDCGVDPEARVYPPPDATTCDLARFHPDIYSLLKEKIKEKMEALGPEYSAPRQISIGGRGRISCLTYTFHAEKAKG